MKWTTKKPVTDGFYFVKCIGTIYGNKFISVVKVYANCTKVFYDGDNFSLNDDCFYEWSDVAIEPPNPPADLPPSGGQVQQLVGQQLPEEK